jgi:hypothetical protein
MIEIDSFILGNMVGIFFTTLTLYLIYSGILENLKKNLSDEHEV